jgi:hypothetical protein
MKIVFESEASGTKIAPVGFSWTTLFYGLWPAVLRKDFKGACMQFFIVGCTLGLAYFYYPFAYNKSYVQKLLAEGYKPTKYIDGSKTMAQMKLGIDLDR